TLSQGHPKARMKEGRNDPVAAYRSQTSHRNSELLVSPRGGTVATREKARQTKKEAGSAEPLDQGEWSWEDPKSLKVNPDFQRLVPLPSRGELLALRESVQAEGCREPLLVWKGHNVVLDGHTRRELCIEFRKKVKVREVELPDEKAATEFILQLQRQRRN